MWGIYVTNCAFEGCPHQADSSVLVVYTDLGPMAISPCESHLHAVWDPIAKVKLDQIGRADKASQEQLLARRRREAYVIKSALEALKHTHTQDQCLRCESIKRWETLMGQPYPDDQAIR